MDIFEYIRSIRFMIFPAIILLFLFIIQLIFPTALELPLLYYWHYENILYGLLRSWPIFLWTFIITLLCLKFNSEDTLKSQNILYERFASDESSLLQCFTISLSIGIREEIIYRWLSFYSCIITSKISNYCFFGCAKLFYLYVEAPIINTMFLTRLRWLLYDQVHWSVGSAAIMSNAQFRDDHWYLGLFGYYNAWCIGFFQFWIMINYGLPAAMCSHAFYDFIIFSMYYAHGVLLRKRKYDYYNVTQTSTSFSRLKECV